MSFAMCRPALKMASSRCKDPWIVIAPNWTQKKRSARPITFRESATYWMLLAPPSLILSCRRNWPASWLMRVGYGHVFNSVTLGVKDGVVTLGGEVINYPDRDSAISLVQNEPGVKDVVANIKVLPTSIFDDQLRLRLARMIYGDPVLSRYAIDPQAPIRIVV